MDHGFSDPPNGQETQHDGAGLGATASLLFVLSGLRASRGQPLNNASPSDDHTLDEDKGPQASLGNVLDLLDERAFGFLLLLLALPCCLPFVYILPQIVALPMLALAAQLAAGRSHPWLPSKMANRTFQIDQFEGVVKRASRYVGWFERLAHPRLTFLTESLGVRVIGALLIIPCASILIPLPSTNTAPGIGVAIASVGLIERDGLLVLFGLLMGLVWVALLLFLGVEGLQLLKAWLLGRA